MPNHCVKILNLLYLKYGLIYLESFLHTVKKLKIETAVLTVAETVKEAFLHDMHGFEFKFFIFILILSLFIFLVWYIRKEIASLR